MLHIMTRMLILGHTDTMDPMVRQLSMKRLAA